MLPLDSRKNHGFTLVEVLVSLGLAAIGAALAMQLWFQFFAQLLDRQKTNQATLAKELGILALEARISQGCGILSVEETKLRWLDCKGEAHVVEQLNDSVFFDGTAMLAQSTKGISFSVLGPRYSTETLDSTYLPWKKLDSDRNGILDFSELDTDYSRSLEGAELAYANLLLVYLETEDATTQTFRILIRSRATNP